MKGVPWALKMGGIKRGRNLSFSEEKYVGFVRLKKVVNVVEVAVESTYISKRKIEERTRCHIRNCSRWFISEIISHDDMKGREDTDRTRDQPPAAPDTN